MLDLRNSIIFRCINFAVLVVNYTFSIMLNCIFLTPKACALIDAASPKFERHALYAAKD